MGGVVEIVGSGLGDRGLMFGEDWLGGGGKMGKNEMKVEVGFVVMGGIVVGKNDMGMREVV